MRSAQDNYARATAPSRRSGRLRGVALAILLAAAAVMPLAGARAAPTVVTTTGTFTGVPSLSLAKTPLAGDVNVFFGIRYAKAPERALRWTPPQPPTPPPGTVVADLPGLECPQPGGPASRE